MRKPHRNGTYPSPYTTILHVDGRAYVIVERQRRGFRAVELTKRQAAFAQRAHDDMHADVEQHVGVSRRRTLPA